MSVSKWAYDPDLCDGKPCPGDCDICYEKLVGWEEEGTAERITANNSNGYSGTLHGREMTIYYHDEEVLHTYAATANNEAELDEVLETMPQFMDMLNEQRSKKKDKGARE